MGKAERGQSAHMCRIMIDVKLLPAGRKRGRSVHVCRLRGAIEIESGILLARLLSTLQFAGGRENKGSVRAYVQDEGNV